MTWPSRCLPRWPALEAAALPTSDVGMHRFNLRYQRSLRDYICWPSEATLRTAYELGRDAVQQELSVMDLAITHHDTLASVLRVEPDRTEYDRIVRAAGDFFLESISAFEMIRRGFQEARDAAQMERRHAEMMRQLSHFLADVSLTLDVSGSLEEMLRLVAEHALDLIAADCCLVETRSMDDPRVRSASYPEDDLRWTTFVRWLDDAEVDAIAGTTGRPTALSADEIAKHVQVPATGSSTDLVPQAWLAAPLLALDGKVMGSIHLVRETDRKFTGLDKAVIRHLAQMSAAAIERARLYSRK
jgi:Phosphoserine phosphatase RsbU, N-terminal domain/GAF domain